MIRGIALTCLGLILLDNAVADDTTRVTRITHVEDSNSDRVPWVTAVPQYPKVARRDRIEGEATVCYLINAKGKIIRPSIRRSSHRMFEKSAMKAIKQSNYEPLKPDQTVSQVKTCRTFRFRLNPIAIEELE